MADDGSRDVMMKELQAIAEEAIQRRLDNHEYKEQRVETWCTDIITVILQKLKETRCPQFKFVASCMILSRQSQFVNETQMAIWDVQRDLKITTKWANESMHCILSIWAFRTRF